LHNFRALFDNVAFNYSQYVQNEIRILANIVFREYKLKHSLSLEQKYCSPNYVFIVAVYRFCWWRIFCWPCAFPNVFRQQWL